MPATTIYSLPTPLDTFFGLVPPLATSNSTTNSNTSVTITGDTVNIPLSGYVSGAGIPVGTTFTRIGTAVTLSNAATASATGVALTYSKVPTTYYYALFTSAPSNAGGGTEVTGGSYARVPVTNNLANFPVTTANNKTNANAITWPTSTAAWGAIVAWGIFDSPTGGNLWFQGSITSVTLNSGDTIQFPIGFFDLTF